MPLCSDGAAQRDAVVEGDPIADLGGLTDDHAHAMIDEQVVTDGGAGVDFDAGQAAHELRYPAGKQACRRCVHSQWEMR